MQKITKSYIEIMYPGFLFNEIDEVENRDPLAVETDGEMQGFRFFDKEIINYGGKEYVGERSNYSPWYLLGKRLSIDEVKELCKHNGRLYALVSNIEYNKIKHVCQTHGGSYLPMKGNDITIDEYKEKMGQTRKLDK